MRVCVIETLPYTNAKNFQDPGPFFGMNELIILGHLARGLTTHMPTIHRANHRHGVLILWTVVQRGQLLPLQMLGNTCGSNLACGKV